MEAGDRLRPEALRDLSRDPTALENRNLLILRAIVALLVPRFRSGSECSVRFCIFPGAVIVGPPRSASPLGDLNYRIPVSSLGTPRDGPAGAYGVSFRTR